MQIDYSLRYTYTRTRAAHSKPPVDPCAMQPIAIYSQFIEMCAWAYGTIYGCRPEMDLYLPVFTACSLRFYTGTVHTIATSLHESPLAIESQL